MLGNPPEVVPGLLNESSGYVGITASLNTKLGCLKLC